MLRGWPSAEHASRVAFQSINPERILWQRKRRRRRRRKRRRRPRRSKLSRPGGASLRPGARKVCSDHCGGLGPPFSFSGRVVVGRGSGRSRYSRDLNAGADKPRRTELHARRHDQLRSRSANARFAPSSAKPPAKVRRSQLITLSPGLRCCRGGEQQPRQRVGGNELRLGKKIECFGLRMLIRSPVAITRRLGRPRARRSIARLARATTARPSTKD
jgi:hypothetical protein